MNTTALVTGASSGIGFEFAKILASKGVDLVLVARSREKMEALAQELIQKHKIKVHVFATDLSQAGAAEKVFKYCEDQSIVVDYLINNAGFGTFGMFQDSNWEKIESMIQVNILALTQLTHLFLPEMLQRKSGKIMNVASTAAFQPGPTMAVYYATKAYVLHFSEAIANEIENSGVTITALCPGPTQSEFQAVADLQESKMVKGRKLVSSAEVAAFGIEAMMKGKTVVIQGFVNAVFANLVRFIPRKAVVKITRWIQDK
jgi:short-subunit dehydrogenase